MKKAHDPRRVECGAFFYIKDTTKTEKTKDKQPKSVRRRRKLTEADILVCPIR
jgi:hypothetical protein